MPWKDHHELLALIYRGDVLDTGNGFPIVDAVALTALLGLVRRRGMRVLEIGSWKGRSSIVAAGAIAPHGGCLYCVDTWEGSEGVAQHAAEVRQKDIFRLFKSNLAAVGLDRNVRSVRRNSRHAAQEFPEAMFDLIFIDGDHRYSGVVHDLRAYLPKLKRGGILCGHDCEGFYPRFSASHRALIEGGLERDTVRLEPGPPCVHAGVIKALFDVLGGDYRQAPGSTVWFHIRPRERRGESAHGLRPTDATGLTTDRAHDVVVSTLLNHPLLPSLFEQPVLLEEGPFNVVHFRGRYHALARAIGPIDLQQATPDLLLSCQNRGEYYSATDLSGVRSWIAQQRDFDFDALDAMLAAAVANSSRS